MLSLLRGRSGKLVDLGSGDGRIVRSEVGASSLLPPASTPPHLMVSWNLQVLAAHRCGLRPAVGYELNPWLVGLARLYAWRAGCASSVCYHREDLWKVTWGVLDPLIACT